MSSHPCHNPIPCVFLHGFLGGKEDWTEIGDILCDKFFCVALDWQSIPKLVFEIKDDHCDVLSLESRSVYITLIQEHIEKIIQEAPCQKKPVLIGYSMGGRIALQLANKNPSFYTHVIILSAHPGLSDPKQREERWKQDMYWMNKLQNLKMDAFLRDWYNQPVFQSLHGKPHLLESIIKNRSSQDPKKMRDIMCHLSLARQLPIRSFHSRTLFLYGEEDTKYKNLYRTLPEEVFVQQVEQSGHVIHLENPKKCAELILYHSRMVLQ